MGNCTHYHSRCIEPAVLFKRYSIACFARSNGFWLYSLVKVAATNLFKERKISTEIFITIAVIVSVIGKEYLAGSVVLMIIFIAEYIASASGEKARNSIKELIGSVPKTAIVKKGGKEERYK